MADISNITLPNEENYDIKDKVARNDIAINRTTLGTQCKNLLKLSHPFGYKYTNADGTATWTFNNDYSVSMVVNSQISRGVAIPISEVTLKKGSYIYSVEGYSTPNITHTQLYSLNADGSWTWLANLSAIENKITVTEETTYSFRAYRNSLVTVGVIETLYPMLRYSDITDSTYEPYKESVDERLINNTSDIAVNKTTLGYQSKNLLKLTLTTKTVSGITFTVNDDYSITLNGTSTAIIWQEIGAIGGNNFRKEKLIFTGNPAGTGSGAGLEAWYMNSTTGNKYVSIANGNILTESDYDPSGAISYEFHINKGKTYNNVTFYPMLRYADITDDTYEPYKPSLQEQITALEERIAALGG